MPMVSVIMAAYNAEKYISESIESIINQTFKEWELIICDDCSSDNTIKIIEEYLNKDKRIKLLKNTQNKKAAYSRNRCIEVAIGKYIAVQDADDISLPSRLEKQIEFLEENKEIDFVGLGLKTLNDFGEFKKKKLIERPKKENFLIHFPFVHASILFKKTVILAVDGYRVSKETTRGEDADMIMRMYAKGYVGANIPDYLYIYREGNEAEKRRTLSKRIDASKIRYYRFKEMGLMPKGLPFLFVPILSFFIPRRFKLNIMLLIKKIKEI